MELSVTFILIALTVLVSVGAFGDRALFAALLYEPFVIKARGQWYRFLTHAFVHANWPHLLVNMFVLFMFGQNVELLLAVLANVGSGSSFVGPTVQYIGLYLGGVLFSALPGYRRHVHDPSYRAVGASGAVSAVLFAQVLMMPTRPVDLLILPIPMPAWVFGVLYLSYSWYMDKRGGDNVAHDAHFYGAIFGILYCTALHPHLLLQLGAFQRTLGL